MPESKKRKKSKKKIIEKPVFPWQKEEPEFEEKIPEKIIRKQEKLAKGWRRT